MQLPAQGLEKWLEERTADQHAFPDGKSNEYVARYAHLKDLFKDRYHSWVNPGATAANGGLLTDHGPGHIDVVIRRASDLVRGQKCVLTPYEVYLTLMAIHLHDVGNVFGREKHEQESTKILNDLGPAAGFDTTEKRIIQMIARVHGGKIGESKDTISTLQTETALLNQPVHPRLLAAIVRLADEYSDQANRAARFLLDGERVPKPSEIFHKYASGLHSVMVQPDTERVELHFSFDEKDFTKKFGKLKTTTYLLDEILERSVKLFTETIYCNRFMRPSIAINSISVSLEIVRVNGNGAPPRKIAYRMEEAGYPSVPKNFLYETNESLRVGQKRLDGATLAKQIRRKQRA
ncbi:MAG: hypothetical protein KIT25_13805 [Enhydrobacter sp.]|nr:MAG: hypothetical protein KIT25_13805 [Enhydrobacter sp.]